MCTQTDWHALAECEDRDVVVAEYQAALADGYQLESGQVYHTAQGTAVSNGFAPRSAS